MFVVFCVGRGFCYELITRSKESYRVRACVCLCVCVRAYLIVCDLETSKIRRPRPYFGSSATKKIISEQIFLERLFQNGGT
jgi:hypothetical protein